MNESRIKFQLDCGERREINVEKRRAGQSGVFFLKKILYFYKF